MTYLQIKQGINKKIMQPLVMFNRRRHFSGRGPTIISVNCIGGGIYHDFGWQFSSPTINLFILPRDYIKFVSRIKDYISLPLEFSRLGYSGKEYPICSIGDGKTIDRVEIHFLHYRDYDECLEKWTERCKRIQWDNILLIFTDQNGCSLDDIYSFFQLPYPKLLFCGKLDVDNIHLKRGEKIIRVEATQSEIKENVNPVDHCMLFRGFSGKRRYEQNADIFDYMRELLDK